MLFCKDYNRRGSFWRRGSICACDWTKSAMRRYVYLGICRSNLLASALCVYLLARLTDRNMPPDSPSLIKPSRHQFAHFIFAIYPMSYPRMDSRLSLRLPCLSICHFSEWALHHLVALSICISSFGSERETLYELSNHSYFGRAKQFPSIWKSQSTESCWFFCISRLTGPLCASSRKVQLSYPAPIQSTPLNYRSQNVLPALWA